MTTLESHTSPATVPSAFRAVVEQHAARPALEAGAVTMTYAELDLLSNRVANGLLARGGEEPVAMVAPLEPTSIVVMLGALKAGRIFVPLDPRDPPERLALVLEQVGALMVSAEAFEQLSASREDDPGLSLDPGQRAIVHFTSGSSGRPKGTIRSHEQLALARVVYDIGPEDRFAIIVPLSFAGSGAPVFGTLLSGATACFFDPITRGLPALAEWIDDAAVTALQTSPSVLRTIAASLDERGRTVRSVRLAIVGGETCRGEDLGVVRRVLPAAVIANHYGSSEAGYVAETRIEPGVELPGGPIAFRRILQEVTIVDGLGQPVAPGETGETVVRGPGVALGYWAEPDEAEQRFVVDEDGVRSARTGDRGRFLPDGTLEYLGRADLRINLHGQTVDPQAVEHALAALPEIEEAVVSPVVGRDGKTRLVAHVLAEKHSQPSARDVRLALAQRLPGFMIPSAFFGVDAIPRTERGKVDREALRRSALGAAPVEAPYTPPRNQREQALAEIVAEVLGIERVGVHDDVFELGADSLSAVELLEAIGERLGVELTQGDLLDAPTIEALTQRTGGPRSPAGRTVFPLHLGGSGTPFFCVSSFDGAMLPLRGLARRLDRPTYSFVPRGVETRARPDQTVERIAARYVRALRTIKPSGPYLVGGYSFGGLVAYEMARQLQADGLWVALLALLDPASIEIPDSRVSLMTGRSDGGVAGFWPRAPRMRSWIVNRAAATTAGIVRWSPQRQSRAYLCLGLRMQRRYRPGPYKGSALVLLTSGREGGNTALSRLLVGETQLVDVPGGHVTMLREPHVATVAARLRDALAAADPMTDVELTRE